jgi:hypothetical protein
VLTIAAAVGDDGRRLDLGAVCSSRDGDDVAVVVAAVVVVVVVIIVILAVVGVRYVGDALLTQPLRSP